MKSPQKIIIIVLILIIVAGVVGWSIGHKTESTNTTASNSSASTSTAGDASSLVSYNLPDGWKGGTCPDAADITYISPAGTSLDCNASLRTPIKIYLDAQGKNDCQQLEGVQNVRKHICSSLYINNHKSLKALTEYPDGTAVAVYYIDTGKGVLAVEYTYTTNNAYQTGFDRLATSIKVN